MALVVIVVIWASPPVVVSSDRRGRAEPLGDLHNLQPLVGVFLAWLIVGEDVGVWQIAGAAFILGGVALTTKRYAP